MSEQKKKILIVEDEMPILESLVDKFTREGFEISVAHNGEEGLKSALEKHPDLILLDIVMPKMDGMTMLKKLREHDAWGQHVPVVLLTNLSADDEMMHKIVETEPSYYLIKKSWTTGDVIQKVREVFGEGK